MDDMSTPACPACGGPLVIPAADRYAADADRARDQVADAIASASEHASRPGPQLLRRGECSLVCGCWRAPARGARAGGTNKEHNRVNVIVVPASARS